ncbi:LysE/ArgO family amino acid transporter [Sporosarcina pasteurii]|uniref:Arginine exporter protein ArgO n=1 Tax=Sporosarcina pasteurii TaxID=1474 RepID=A0A380CHZ7_SPOPA|nr:LysE/ArgO family amino acid transporter [Sporosarcina pasteurii]MDS9472063.1 LysE/ArgO family amino acid transporter [Sporosarcina pasteurii]QBQ06790.1 amino acid transporter [Sporosarcina pasteurii]SUJ20885.1 Arginine exporter protein ArgO [Sporosarcina pasteurii]
MVEAIIHGVILAFGLIIPLGAQNVFVFNQGALQPKFRKALPVVITAGISDTILIVAAVSGVSLLILTFSWLENIIFSIGIIFLLYMGVVLWRTKVSTNDLEGQSFSMKRQILFAASVSLLNPHALLDTIGVIGTNSLSYIGDAKIAFTLTTIFVSWIWFIGLALSGRYFGKLDKSGKLMTLLNKVSALVVFGVAVYMALKLYSNLA